jgi:hypothetical protein
LLKHIMIIILWQFALPVLAVKDVKNRLPLLKPVSRQPVDNLALLNKTVGTELLKAITNKRLVVQPHTRTQIFEMSRYGFAKIPGGIVFGYYTAYASPELLSLLHYLINNPEITEKKPFKLLSLFRLGSKAHAQVQSGGTLLGRAIDIDAYAGYRINMADPQTALSGIVKVIEKLPRLNYVLGLPRPGGGSKIDPARDFFLPVTSLSQNERSPTGSLKGDLALIKNSAAKKKISEAIAKNKNAMILFLVPDAVDHLHVKAVEPGKIQ